MEPLEYPLLVFVKLNHFHVVSNSTVIFLDEMVEMIEEFSFLGFPLSGNEFRKIAFDFAEDNGFEGLSKIHNEAFS